MVFLFLARNRDNVGDIADPRSIIVSCRFVGRGKNVKNTWLHALLSNTDALTFAYSRVGRCL